MVENDIDIGVLIKKAVRSIIRDPGYIILYLLPVLIYFIFMSYMWLTFGDITGNLQNIQDPSGFYGILKERILPFTAATIIFAIISIILNTVVIAGLIKKVEMQGNQRRMSVSDAFSFGLKIFPRVFAAMILGAIIIAGPFLGLLTLMVLAALNNITELICLTLALMVIIFIPWIYYTLRLSLYLYSCVLDNLGPIDCFKKSWHISKGNITLVFVTWLILMIISIAITAPFIILNNFTPSNPYIFIGYSIAYAIIGPMSIVTFTLLYLRLSRKQKNKVIVENRLNPLS